MANLGTFVILLSVARIVYQDVTESPSFEVTLPTNSCSNNSDSEMCLVTTNAVNVTELDFNSTSEVNTTDDYNMTTVTEVTDGNETTEFTTTEEATSMKPTPTIPSPTDAVTTEEPAIDSRYVPEDICTCDLTVDSCDINCCCDEDCTPADRLVFVDCKRRTSPSVDSRYCYRSQFIYHNNTELKVTRDIDGFFCIVKANLPAQFHFKRRQVVTTVKEFNRLLERRPFYRWPAQDARQLVFTPSTSYKAESILWSFLNTSLVPFGMPTKLTSATCQTMSPVRYLTDWSGSCSQTNLDCSGNEALSAVSYYENVSVVAMPQLLNQTFLLEQQECPCNICIPVTPLLCSLSSNLDECLESDSIELPSQVCANVVRQVKYVVYHNGTQGIVKIEAYIWLTDLLPTQEEVTQSFSVSFLWADKPKNPFVRSGNPGYVVGKPVIAGCKVVHFSDEESEPDKEAIELSEDRSKWLTIPKASHSGLCDSRRSVTFGENLRSSCYIPLQSYNFTSVASCSALQKHVLRLLAGDAIDNITEAKQFNKYVATFGDSDVEETGDWVRVLLESVPTIVSSTSSRQDNLICNSIITSLHIDIVFASIGSQSNPQSKILGVVLKFGSAHDLVFSCAPLPCANVSEDAQQRYEVLSSVSFLDLTKPPVAQFAEPPVYEVKLPHDFFYPFLSTFPTSYISRDIAAAATCQKEMFI